MRDDPEATGALPNGVLLNERDGKFRLHWHPAQGFGHAILTGLWTAEDALAFSPPFKAMVERSRRLHQRALLILDASGAKIQSITSRNATPLLATDLVAVVVTSTLLKREMKRARIEAGGNALHEYFTCPVDAKAWLLEMLESCRQSHIPADAYPAATMSHGRD